MKRTLSSALPLFLMMALAVYPACTKKEAESVPSASMSAAPTADAASPAEVVKQFVALSAAAKGDADRDKLQSMCSGEMRRAFERMSPEAFKITYVNSNIKVKEVKIIEAKVSSDSNVSVQYEVSIENPQGSDTTTETNRRTVELTRAQNMWLIESIRPEGSDKVAFTRGMYF